MNGRMSRFAGPILLSLIVIVFNWKLVLTNQYTWLESVDISTQVLPWFQFQAGEWHRWRIPLWDPTSWYGQPIFGLALPAPAHPLNWLLFWSSLRNGWMRQSHLHWYYVIVRVLAALSAYALCRELGRSRRASVLGGILYGIGGYVGNTDWPQTVNGAITSPLVFLYLFRAERTRAVRDALLSGFFMGFGWLAGHHQMNLLVSLAAGSLWIWLAVREGWNARIAKLVCMAIVIGAMASALQTIPTAEYGRRAVRWAGAENPLAFDEKVPYFVHQQLSMQPLALLAPMFPGLHSGSEPYVGIVAVTIAVLGAIFAWREKHVRWLVAVAACAMLYSLGFSSILHGVLYALVPLVEKSRTPVAGTVVFGMAIAPLAAFGLDTLPRSDSSQGSIRAGRVLWTVGALLACLLFANRNADQRLMITALAAVTGAIVFAMLRSGAISAMSATVVLLAAVLLELGTVTNYQLPNRLVPGEAQRLHLLADHSDVATYLRTRGEQGRIEYDDSVIPYNFGAWYGLETMLASGASAPEDLWKLGIFSPRSRNFFGVQFWIGKQPNRPDQFLVYRGANGIDIYENPASFPRAFAVHSAIVEPDVKSLRARFSDPAVNLRTTALLPAAVSLETCDPARDEVFVPVHQPNRVRIDADLGCQGLVILTDNWFPGWSATVDGKPAGILQVNGAVRGVVVEKGAHRIEMIYRPMSVIAGAALTFASVALVLAAFFYPQKMSAAQKQKNSTLT